MTTLDSFDTCMERVTAGERLSPAEIRELAGAPDILPLGMLADAARRRLHDTRVTFLRVAVCAFDKPFADGVPPTAGEIRITGSPEQLSVAISAVESAKAVAGVRAVSGFTWADVERLAAGGRIAGVLAQLREAGLESLAELPLDGVADIAKAIDALATAGFKQLRCTIDKVAAGDRTNLLLRAAELQEDFQCIQAINPLPMTLGAFRPTTGYEDVKMVAVARLAAPNVPTIQVDWRRYGPKLAQVALTFGADDVDGVSPSDEAPEGRRRAPLEEIQRNIEAAGFQPAERTGRFTVIA
jgi:aminodeoxyfutalosine synthase